MINHGEWGVSSGWCSIWYSWKKLVTAYAQTEGMALFIVIFFYTKSIMCQQIILSKSVLSWVAVLLILMNNSSLFLKKVLLIADMEKLHSLQLLTFHDCQLMIFTHAIQLWWKITIFYSISDLPITTKHLMCQDSLYAKIWSGFD